MTTGTLRTYLDVALASVQTVMMELEGAHEMGLSDEKAADAFAQLHAAYARVVQARRVLR